MLRTTSRKTPGAPGAPSEREPERDRCAWWAVGDAPVRVARTLVPLVDGRAAMLAMCAAFLTAKQSIRLADWGIYVRLRMVRGTDQRAGPDGAEEQYVLMDRLRAAGLGREALALWESGNLRVMDVLGFAARRRRAGAAVEPIQSAGHGAHHQQSRAAGTGAAGARRDVPAGQE
jgi:hypothetical protein